MPKEEIFELLSVENGIANYKNTQTKKRFAIPETAYSKMGKPKMIEVSGSDKPYHVKIIDQ